MSTPRDLGVSGVEQCVEREVASINAPRQPRLSSWMAQKTHTTSNDHHIKRLGTKLSYID